MGIQSLTKFLDSRSQQYFEKYQLSSCSLVIDGNGICNNLYNWQSEYWKVGFSYYCYGGDYDKFAHIVKRFFQMLHKCNVTPYIVFDGCNENHKVSAITERLNEKAKIYSKITPNSDHPTYAIGAVALRFAFRDVTAELGLKTYTCSSDANRKMASLAKHLNCPVLSADSDFFISSALFIPFSSMDCKIKENEKFIHCKLYRIEKMVNCLGTRPDMHYLVPVLLGNNQFNTNIFNPFFKKHRILGNRQKIVDLIFRWISTQRTLEAAIQAILQNFYGEKQKLSVLMLIKNTILGYAPISVTSILEFFYLEVQKINEIPFSFKKIEEVVGIEIKEVDIEDIQVSESFEKKFVGSDYPAFFIDMLIGNRYFVWPNIEDCSKPDANSIGYNIMVAIHNVLVQAEEKQLTVLRRNSNVELENFLLPTCQYPLPSIEELEYLKLERKRDIIFQILEIHSDFAQIFDAFPKEWHLFVLALKYSVSKSKFNSGFIYSLVFCFLTLNYIDPNLCGFYRSTNMLPNIQKISQSSVETVENKRKFSTICKEDSVTFMQKFIKYFQYDPKDVAETYDRGIMHSIAEFQCVFLHLKYLNVLFVCPFEDSYIHKIFDGTFIYNMAKKLSRETSLKDYLATYLQECPSIYCVFIYVIELFENHSIL